MKVLVTGGRKYADKDYLFKVLDYINQLYTITILVHGDATGADSLADYWARERKIEVRRHPAEWKLYGKAAGTLRNKSMLKKEDPDIVVAFPGGTGTGHMVSIARADLKDKKRRLYKLIDLRGEEK